MKDFYKDSEWQDEKREEVSRSQWALDRDFMLKWLFRFEANHPIADRRLSEHLNEGLK